jgi:hypothetical protein
VRAATVRVRDQFVMARYGKLAREQFRRAASRELQTVFVTPGDVWIDFDLFVESTALVCEIFGDGREDFARVVGAFAAEANMGAWRSLVHRLVSPRTMMELAGMFWSHHYDGGRLSTSLEGNGGLRIKLDDFPRPHRLHCLSIAGWAQRIIELGKPKHASLREVSCRLHGDRSCEFIGEWE